MNDDIQKSPIDVLNKAFAPKQGELVDPKKGYDHPRGEDILQGAKRILGYSATGQELLTYIDEKDLTIKVLKDDKDSAYISAAKLAVLTCPASQNKAYPSTVLDLIRIIREAQQEELGYPRPSPHLPDDEYLEKIHEKQEDIFVKQFKVAYDLWKNMDIVDLLNQMKKDGDEQYINNYVNHMETISE
ncbi:MAG: hypothetical protein CMH32_02685 [Micavibrio sp.]|nr:hypothetical protein [Micavibrio sp.]HCK33193.1 hypothetical protein [Rhodospirillaceae bacterium]|tara:strand:- start:161 stop:721 length:561 start_codon:yes stop_codon:yes gene_type:complete